MVDLYEIKAEIAALLEEETTFDTCEKLACLITVKEYLESRSEAVSSPEPIGYGSEFMQAVRGAEISSVLRILDEHMDALKLLYPKEYAAILRKISLS